MIRQLAFIISIAIVISCTNNPDKKVSDKSKAPVEEFSDMKFGMFIHWGLYAIPGGIWEGEEIKGIGEWIMKRAEIPAADYAELAKQFNPVKFNAEAWAQLAVDAGMRYLVITSKHHDGFAMYKSEASDYNIVDATPYNKDPMVSLSKESRKRGMEFGFYYSQAQDWYEPNAAGNTWDFPEERDPSPYLQQKVFPQVDELLRNYGDLGLIWFDTPQLLTKEQVKNLYYRVKELQPGCLVNSRIGYGMGDYDQLGDNQVPVEVRAGGKVWEVPATLNETWGFKYTDHHWKDPEELIFNLVDIISKGGNYLLNVGPDADGMIPTESQKILREMGQWVNLNQEAVYATGHSPFYPKGVSWRFTTKPNALYVHIVKPENIIQIDGLISRVKSAQILSSGAPVEFAQKKGKLIIKLTEKQLQEMTPVVKLSIADEMAAVQEGFAWNHMQTEIEMPSRITRMLRKRQQPVSFPQNRHGHPTRYGGT